MIYDCTGTGMLWGYMRLLSQQLTKSITSFPRWSISFEATVEMIKNVGTSQALPTYFATYTLITMIFM